MEKYKEIKKNGDGAFGTVMKAQNTQTGEIVAIKTMKQTYATWDECMNLRELKALRKLIHHNIIKLKEVVRVSDYLHFIFEFIEKNIYQLYTEQKQLGKQLSDDSIKSIFYQITSSLAYIHKNGFFHRDLKPENILQSEKGIIKLIDFGLAREIRSRPPFTDYVSTRWYRAPECLLRSTTYNSPIDIFALGCIIVELYQMKPLFNGNSEIDQLNKIISVLGTPSKQEWPDGYRLASMKGYTFQQYNPIPLEQIITNAPNDAIQLISDMLKWDPLKRPTAQKILSYSYFSNIQNILPNELNQSIIQKQQQQQKNSNNINNNNNSNKKKQINLNNDQNHHPPQKRLIASREGRENIYSDVEKIDTLKCYDENQQQYSNSNKKPLNNMDSNKLQQNYKPSQFQISNNDDQANNQQNQPRNSQSQKHMELDTIYEFLNNGEAKNNQKNQFQHYQQQNIAHNNNNKQLSIQISSQVHQDRLNQKKHNINYQQLNSGIQDTNKQKTQTIENIYSLFDQQQQHNLQLNQNIKDRNQRASSLQQPNYLNKNIETLPQQQNKYNDNIYSAIQTSHRELDDVLGKYIPTGISAQGSRAYNPSPPPYNQQKGQYVSSTMDIPRIQAKSVNDNQPNNNTINNTFSGGIQAKNDIYNFGGIPKPQINNISTNNNNSQHILPTNKLQIQNIQTNSQKQNLNQQNEIYNFNNIALPPRNKNL